MTPTRPSALLVCAGWLVACSSSPLKSGAEPSPDAGGPAPVNAGVLGDGNRNSVTLSVLFTPSTAFSATALAFNRVRPNELWVTLRHAQPATLCTPQSTQSCAALAGQVLVFADATLAAPTARIEEDGNSWHFMRRPTAIAWGSDETFATCGEARTDNYEDEAVPFAGPVLWSSDPAIFGVTPGMGQNGTHLDMLHETPYCMGLAHESGNVYWAVNGDAGALDRYDFHAPHAIGGADHSDGEVHRYIAGELLRVADVPSHVAVDADSGLVYVADTGHGRVLSVDPSSATPGGAIQTWEPLVASGEMLGARVEEVIAPGTLQAPSGLFLSGELLLVTDNQSSVIHAFDRQGHEQNSLDTGLEPGSLAGVTIGPDGKVYFSDLHTGSVYRIDPRGD